MIAKLRQLFVVHCQQFGLPDLFFGMRPCGLHIYYLKKMGEFGFIQMVKDNMTLFSKRQIAGATQAKDLFKKMIFPSTANFGVSSVHVVSWVVMLH